MYQKFDDFLKDLQQTRPSKAVAQGRVFYFNEHEVFFQPGEMEGIHWVDIQIQLKRFRVETLPSAKKVLEANQQMGASTPIPSWFAIDSKTDTLVFVNRLDWRHLSAKIVDEHVMRCIDQMTSALMSEGV